MIDQLIIELRTEAFEHERWYPSDRTYLAMLYDAAAALDKEQRPAPPRAPAAAEEPWFRVQS